jgi:hypothetical protein
MSDWRNNWIYFLVGRGAWGAGINRIDFDPPLTAHGMLILSKGLFGENTFLGKKLPSVD